MTELGRVCSPCATWKEWDEFYPSSKGANGRAYRCKECAYWSSKPISAVEFAELVATQGGCAICGGVDKRTRLALDHDHSCCAKGCRECIRGAACRRCNNAIGLLENAPGPRAAEMLSWYLSRRPFSSRK